MFEASIFNTTMASIDDLFKVRIPGLQRDFSQAHCTRNHMRPAISASSRSYKIQVRTVHRDNKYNLRRRQVQAIKSQKFH